MKYPSIVKTVAAALLILPLLLAPALSSAEETVVSGTFKGLSNHVTTGGVSVVKTADGMAVVLADNFSFDGAPDPKVGFGTSGKYDLSTQLAHLKSNNGKQVYTIPASVDISGYNEIYIWCEAYSVPLGVAAIK